MSGATRLLVRQHHNWLVLRTTTSQTSCHSNVLLAIHAERNRKSLHSCTQTCLPQRSAGLHVNCAELPVEVTNEGNIAGGREHRCEERRTLLKRPGRLKSFFIICGNTAHIEIGRASCRERV